MKFPRSHFVSSVGLCSVVVALGALALGGCRSQAPDPTATPQSQRPILTPPPDAEPPPPAPVAVEDAAPPAPPPEPLEGAVLTKEIEAAYRVAACAGPDSFFPPNLDREIVAQHCAQLQPEFATYKREWLDVAMPFIASKRPPNLPKTVVYPFGGGDLVSALATFPDATDFTTISLEIAGDVRGVMKADNKRLKRELATLRDHLGKLFLKAHSRTVNLEIETRVAIPGEMAFTMAALAIHGFEPVSVRYFRFRDDGSLVWLDSADLDAPPKQGVRTPFANAEVRFKKAGDGADPTIRVLRHVAYDLSDGYLKKHPGLMRYLDTKPKVAAMTKAASHLLWDDANFSTIRDWLVGHTDWMISDTTGLPPRIAKKNGYVQDTYGQYEWPEPFGPVNNRDATDFKELFKGNAPLPFRYGYPDNKSHGHMVITHRP